jgi:hypothetical protein
MRERPGSSAAHPSGSTSHHEPLNWKPIFSSRSKLFFRDSAWLEACAILHWHFVHAVGSIEEDLFLHIRRVSAKIVACNQSPIFVIRRTYDEVKREAGIQHHAGHPGLLARHN